MLSGIGPDLDAARRRAVSLPGVEVTGYADYAATPDVYRGGDVFVSPTYAEGFSNTILEAMATGMPIVSCRAVGVVDCLEHDRNGLLACVADVPDLTRQIARLLDDDVLLMRLAGEALQEARATYSWHAIGRQISGIYEQLGPAADRQSATDRHEDPLPFRPAEPCRYRSEPHLL